MDRALACGNRRNTRIYRRGHPVSGEGQDARVEDATVLGRYAKCHGVAEEGRSPNTTPGKAEDGGRA